MAVYPYGLNRFQDSLLVPEPEPPLTVLMAEAVVTVIQNPRPDEYPHQMDPEEDEPKYPWYLNTNIGRFIPAGPHGDYQYGSGATESLIGIDVEDTFKAVMEITPLGNGVVRLVWNIPNKLNYSWVMVCRSLYGPPVSPLESKPVFRALRSTAYSTLIDAGLPHGREVSYTIFVLSTDAIQRWIPVCSDSIVVANDAWVQNTFREQLPDMYWERDLLQAEQARIPGNDPARPSDGQLWRLFDLMGPELLTSKAMFDLLVSMRDPRLCPTAMLEELAKLMGGLPFIGAPPERLREVLSALIYFRRQKGTAAAFTAVLSGLLNCPIEISRNTNVVLDINSSQEFFPTAVTPTPGFWWPGNTETHPFQLAPDVMNPESADRTMTIGEYVWGGTTLTTTPAAGNASRGATGYFYLHQTDADGNDVTALIEPSQTIPWGSNDVYVWNLDDPENYPWPEVIFGPTTALTASVWRFQGTVSFTLSSWVSGTRIRVEVARQSTDPPQVVGVGLLGATVRPVTADFNVRSAPPGDLDSYIEVRDYGIPVSDEDEFFLLSAYVVSQPQALVVNAVIEFWDEDGFLDGTRLTSRTYLNLEAEYTDYADIEASWPAPNDQYLKLLLQPEDDPSGAVPGSVVVDGPVTTVPWVSGAATWRRVWTMVMTPGVQGLPPPTPKRVVMRFFATGQNADTIFYVDAVQMERLRRADLPKLGATEYVDWDAIGPGPYQPARTANILIHPFRRNMVRNPRGVGKHTVTTRSFVATQGSITSVDPGVVPPQCMWVFKVKGAAATGTLAGQYPSATGDRGWHLSRAANGDVTLTLSLDGVSSDVSATVSGPVPSGQYEYLALARYDDDVNWVVRLYQSFTLGSTWVLLGESAPQAHPVPYDSIAVLRLGSLGDNTTPTAVFGGEICWLEQRTGGMEAISDAGSLAPSGTVQWRFDADEYPGSAAGTSFTDPRGRLWTLQGTNVMTEATDERAVWWDGYAEPPDEMVRVRSVGDNDAEGDAIQVLEVDHGGVPFGMVTEITAEQCSYIASMVGVSFAVKPIAAGRFRFRIRVEYLDVDTGVELHSSQTIMTAVGQYWTTLFHGFDLVVRPPFKLRLYIVLIGEADLKVPTDWGFRVTDVLVDDITEDLAYFDGATPTQDEEYGWLGEAHESESGAWPQRERRENYVEFVAENWLPANAGWTATYDDGRTLSSFTSPPV